MTAWLCFVRIIFTMLMIRLQRVGRKHETTFRIVLTDSKNSAKSGKYAEVLGVYDPRGGKTEIKKDRVKYWLSVGAKATGTVHNILVNNKVVEGKKVNVMPKRKKLKEEKVAAPKEKAPETPAPEPAPAPAETPAS